MNKNSITELNTIELRQINGAKSQGCSEEVRGVSDLIFYGVCFLIICLSCSLSYRMGYIKGCQDSDDIRKEVMKIGSLILNKNM